MSCLDDLDLLILVRRVEEQVIIRYGRNTARKGGIKNRGEGGKVHSRYAAKGPPDRRIDGPLKDCVATPHQEYVLIDPGRSYRWKTLRLELK